MKVLNEKDLSKAVNNNQDTIEIEGNLSKKVLKIKATGKIAWAVAITAIGIAVGAAILAIPSGGSAAPVGIMAAPAAIGILGYGTTMSAISIAVASGGVGVLNSLRRYKVVSSETNRVVLCRK